MVVFNADQQMQSPERRPPPIEMGPRRLIDNEEELEKKLQEDDSQSVEEHVQGVETPKTEQNEVMLGYGSSREAPEEMYAGNAPGHPSGNPNESTPVGYDGKKDSCCDAYHP